MVTLERDNYYILLGLAFDPPVTDPGQIKAALRAKKQEWTRWQDNPGRRNLGLMYLGQATEIERVLLDPALSRTEAEAARALCRDMLRQFECELRILEIKGYILPREAAAIAQKYKSYGVDQKTIAEYAKAPISETPPPPRDDDAAELLDRVTAQKLQRDLQLLGESSLYSFLGEKPYSSIRNLLAAAEAKRRAAASQGGKSAAATVEAELAGAAATIFESVASKQKYDRWLKVSRYPAVAQLIEDEYARSSFIGPEVTLRIAGFAVERYEIKVIEAEEYIKAYCAAYGIPSDRAGGTCPNCGNRTASAPVCPACAQPLSGTCPGCGEEFSGGPAVCAACGFAVGEMGKALRHMGDAENALIEGNWGTAQRALGYVQRYWPTHPKLEVLEKRAHLLEERYARYLESIEDCVRHGQFFAADELIREAASRGMRLPQALCDRVMSRLREFESRIEQIRADESEPEIAELLSLAGQVSDSIELARLLSLYPPDAPAGVRAEAEGRRVFLRWDASPSPQAVTYLLVRKQEGIPLTAFDGDLLYEGGASSYTDDAPPPLRDVYYSVFAKRAGAYSRQGATADPLLIIPEIENLRILPLDGGAQLCWAFNSDIRAVEIWRKLGGDAPTQSGEGIRLECDRLDGFCDQKLKNDVDYWYFIVASYIVNGRQVSSRGVCGSVVPRKPVAPLEKLTVTATGEPGEYIASWDAAQNPGVVLFASVERPGVAHGDVLAVEDLFTRYRKLDLDYRRADATGFKLSVAGGVYLFPAVVSGRFATLSAPHYLVNVPEVKNPGYTFVADDLLLTFDWPDDVPEVVASCRFDRIPDAPDEIGAAVISCGRAAFQRDGGLLIHDAKPEIYYLRLCAVAISENNDRVSSRGAVLVADNRPRQEVFYSCAYKKKRFSEAARFELGLSSSSALELPKTVIVGRRGRLPLSVSDGDLLFELEQGTRVGGSATLPFPAESLPDDLYVRLFFSDGEAYKRFRLIPSTNPKLT